MLLIPKPLRLRVLLLHLIFSVLLIAGLTYLVFNRWYPGELLELQGGVPILGWVVGITLVVGPLLTFILFRPEKKRTRELVLDIALILALQVGAFGYGVWTLSIQRPTYLAFLHDRFFVITARDVLGAVPAEVEAIPPWSNGPRPVFVKLSFGAELEAAKTVYGLDEAPPMAMLPGAYAPLSEGRMRLKESGAAEIDTKTGLINVPVIGRAGKGMAFIEVEKGELLRIKSEE